MKLTTNLNGRLHNTRLPVTRPLLPLFEAVVNSIQSIESLNDSADGWIRVDILRHPQLSLDISADSAQREDIVGFRVTDNGSGFDDENLKSFSTLDSDYKLDQGCRGVGRLVWLKAFETVRIRSSFIQAGECLQRTFSFSPPQGIRELSAAKLSSNGIRETSVHLDGFRTLYRRRAPKTLAGIASSLLEHCLWYFIRGLNIRLCVCDGPETADLSDLYDEMVLACDAQSFFELKGHRFDVTHLRLRWGPAKTHSISWCAAKRLVREESIKGKIVGLHGKLSENGSDFAYACVITSPFLDEHVHSERDDLDVLEVGDDLFADSELCLAEIRNAVLMNAEAHLLSLLQENRKAGRNRVDQFVARRAPRYRSILPHVSEDALSVDPSISDRELDAFLHRQLFELEAKLLIDGTKVSQPLEGENSEQYRRRLEEYRRTADDLKKSDLANYVFHRKVIIDILEQAVKKVDGKYAKEELIHQLIMPLRQTSNEVSLDNCNLWLVDERLAFHDFLASDRPLCSMPITSTPSTKEPDLCALNVFDEPVLVSDTSRLPLASITVVELKRPMRNDAAPGEEKDPLHQALLYLQRIRDGGTKTHEGRQIPHCQEIPGFCYVICDLTPTVVTRCRVAGLTVTSDHTGYFGYNPYYKAYIEVLSFDRLINGARERNRAFFDKLGLPSS